MEPFCKGDKTAMASNATHVRVLQAINTLRSSGRQSMRSDLPGRTTQTRATRPGTLPGIDRIPGKRLMATARVFEREFDASCDNL